MNDNIKMPYHETDEYVSRLVSDTTERVLRRQKATRSIPIRRLAAAAAAVLLLAVGGVTYYRQTADVKPLTALSEENPVDDFLSSLTDEEVQMITYYEVEEITVDNY
jgi:hypothetical protein